jgi:hypothetical protein
MHVDERQRWNSGLAAVVAAGLISVMITITVMRVCNVLPLIHGGRNTLRDYSFLNHQNR